MLQKTKVVQNVLRCHKYLSDDSRNHFYARPKKWALKKIIFI